MTLIDVLDDSVAFPLALPLTPGHHMGVPTAVLEKIRGIHHWSLVAWNDDVSGTLGLARDHSLLVLERSDIEAVSIVFKRPAKGPGWVSLQVKMKNQRLPVTLLKSEAFREEALKWLLDRKLRMEALFCLEIFVCDNGTDC